MVRPVLKASVDLLEEREKLAPLEPLDLLDSLDLLLVPFISEHFCFANLIRLGYVGLYSM